MIGKHIHPNWNWWCWWTTFITLLSLYWVINGVWVVIFAPLTPILLWCIWVELQDDPVQALIEL